MLPSSHLNIVTTVLVLNMSLTGIGKAFLSSLPLKYDSRRTVMP
jgi:hypothetical protein